MRCPNCHEEMDQGKTWKDDGTKWDIVTCSSCYMTFPRAETKAQAQTKYHQTIKKIRELYPERISMGANVEKARREINDLKAKKKPTNSDLNRMETLVSYSHSYINFACAVREAEILNQCIESFITGMEIMEEKLWTQ